MWLVCQTAVKVPSDPMVAVTVLAHVQLVWWPERWIWIVWPASCVGAVPENCRPLPRMPEALVWRVMPSPLVDTFTLPLWTEGAVPVAGPVVVVPVVVVPVDVATGEPPGDTLAPPPEAASAAAGSASAPATSAGRAWAYRRRRVVTESKSPMGLPTR